VLPLCNSAILNFKKVNYQHQEMSSNYEKSIEAIKAKNGGQLPSDLYNLTNAQLGQMLYNLTGNIKHKMPARVSKESLVKRIEKLTQPKPAKADKGDAAPVTGSKRKMEEGEPSAGAPKKVPRNCLQTLSSTQLAQMKRVMAMTHEQVIELQHEKDLKPLWSSIGMVSNFV
jgi:hypothetical protein